jgi:ABC-type nitrate/sulfonate/bicarbonate transport system substrate-binding protein
VKRSGAQRVPPSRVREAARPVKLLLVLRRSLIALVAAAFLLAACTTGVSVSPSLSSASGSGDAGPTPTPTPGPSLPPADLTTLVIGVSGTDPAHFTVPLAFYAGRFEKYGLSVELTSYASAEEALAALARGEIQVASASSGQTIASLATRTPAVDVAVITRARSVASSSPAPSASPSPPASKAASPAPTPGPPTPSPTSSPSARPTPPPTPYAGANVMVLRSFADEHPNTVLRLTAAVLEAAQLPFTDLDTVVRGYATWAKLDAKAARAAFQAYLASGTTSRGLRASSEAYAATRDDISRSDKALAKVKLGRAFDGSFLDRLAELGLTEALKVPG